MANPLLFFSSNEIAGGRNCSSRIIDRISFNDDETLMIVVDARERTLIKGRGFSSWPPNTIRGQGFEGHQRASCRRDN